MDFSPKLAYVKAERGSLSMKLRKTIIELGPKPNQRKKTKTRAWMGVRSGLSASNIKEKIKLKQRDT
jgi:hypothetical protein